MTTPTSSGHGIVHPLQACAAARWLGLAAAPSFALMAWISATGAPQPTMGSSTEPLSIGGMAWMYLLMSIFHLSPWLNLASRREWQLPSPTTQAEGD